MTHVKYWNDDQYLDTSTTKERLIKQMEEFGGGNPYPRPVIGVAAR